MGWYADAMAIRWAKMVDELQALVDDLYRENAALKHQLAQANETIAQMEDAMDMAGERLLGEDN
jgi:hypothetical protein